MVGAGACTNSAGSLVGRQTTGNRHCTRSKSLSRRLTAARPNGRQIVCCARLARWGEQAVVAARRQAGRQEGRKEGWQKGRRAGRHAGERPKNWARHKRPGVCV